MVARSTGAPSSEYRCERFRDAAGGGLWNGFFYNELPPSWYNTSREYRAFRRVHAQQYVKAAVQRNRAEEFKGTVSIMKEQLAGE